MTAAPQQDVPSGHRRRQWRPVMYGLLLLAAIFAAWQAHELQQSMKVAPPPPEPPRMDPNTLGSGLAKIRQRGAVTGGMPTTQPSTVPWDLLDPFAGSEVQVVPKNEDPVGIAPPTGASLAGTFRAPDGSVIANYVWIGVLAEAVRQYEQTFQEAGYNAMPFTTDEEGRHYLSFEGKGRRFVVVLRSTGPDGKIVSIDVTVIPMPR